MTDGYNINDNCGSTHPELLAEKVLETESDFGLAFDGDGDRLIAVDEKVILLMVTKSCLLLVKKCIKPRIKQRYDCFYCYE